jgi:hypothetical protein
VVSEPVADIRHGTKIGRFVVGGELGKGGMGVVYAAHDRELDRQVALKVMRSAAATHEERMRMLREGQAMARITHPNVITVYEVGVEGGHVFLAQELLDDGTLGDWLDEEPRSQTEILDKFIAAGRGLAAAHAAGLVHRDFKPHNVLLGEDGRVRVADFGLARALGPDGADDLPAATRANMARAQLEEAVSPMSPLTRTGAVLGTPMFMAPEQHEGKPADARSDQFAFSVALYHALYGEYPFAGQTAVALADAVLAGRMQKPPRGNRVPARLRKILLRGLSTDRERRYPSMNAMLAELATPPRRPLRKVAIAIGAGVLVAGAVAGGYALRTRDEQRTAPAQAKAVVDPATPSNERDVQWLSTAIERGQHRRCGREVRDGRRPGEERGDAGARLDRALGRRARARAPRQAGRRAQAARGRRRHEGQRCDGRRVSRHGDGRGELRQRCARRCDRAQHALREGVRADQPRARGHLPRDPRQCGGRDRQPRRRARRVRWRCSRAASSTRCARARARSPRSTSSGSRRRSSMRSPCCTRAA